MGGEALGEPREQWSRALLGVRRGSEERRSGCQIPAHGIPNHPCDRDALVASDDLEFSVVRPLKTNRNSDHPGLRRSLRPFFGRPFPWHGAPRYTTLVHQSNRRALGEKSRYRGVCPRAPRPGIRLVSQRTRSSVSTCGLLPCRRWPLARRGGSRRSAGQMVPGERPRLLASELSVNASASASTAPHRLRSRTPRRLCSSSSRASVPPRGC